MAILLLVETINTQDGSVVQLAKFIPKYLETVVGSAGYGGTPVYDPETEGKDWAIVHGAMTQNIYIAIIDTQAYHSEYFRTELVCKECELTGKPYWDKR